MRKGEHATTVDIGDQDMEVATDYAKSFGKRLESRGIPADRANADYLILTQRPSEKLLNHRLLLSRKLFSPESHPRLTKLM